MTWELIKSFASAWLKGAIVVSIVVLAFWLISMTTKNVFLFVLHGFFFLGIFVFIPIAAGLAVEDFQRMRRARKLLKERETRYLDGQGPGFQS